MRRGGCLACRLISALGTRTARHSGPKVFFDAPAFPTFCTWCFGLILARWSSAQIWWGPSRGLSAQSCFKLSSCRAWAWGFSWTKKFWAEACFSTSYGHRQSGRTWWEIRESQLETKVLVTFCSRTRPCSPCCQCFPCCRWGSFVWTWLGGLNVEF